MTPAEATSVGRTKPEADDSGSVTLLSLGFAVVAIVLILVVAAATGLHLDRLRATRLADDVAVAAADSLDLDRFYAGALAEPTDHAAVPLSPTRVEDEAQEALERLARDYGLDEVRLVSATSPDGFTVVITIEATSPPIAPVAVLAPWADGVTLTVTASARAY